MTRPSTAPKKFSHNPLLAQLLKWLYTVFAMGQNHQEYHAKEHQYEVFTVWLLYVFAIT